MNIILGLQHKAVLAWQHLFPVNATAMAGANTPTCRPTARPAVPCQRAVAPPTRSLPLRVVRVMDADQTRTSAGRLVISGRMADVCAELDRLAAREAALT